MRELAASLRSCRKTWIKVEVRGHAELEIGENSDGFGWWRVSSDLDKVVDVGPSEGAKAGHRGTVVEDARAGCAAGA